MNKQSTKDTVSIMLWDIHDYSREQWEKASQGNWDTNEKSIFKNPSHLKYYMSDNFSDKLPLMRFTILGEPEMDDDYARPMRPVLAIAEFKQFDEKNDPQGWSMPYITVDPSLQKTGVARLLFRHALQWLKKHDSDVIVHRTANSVSGMHWQHVADTELFAAKIPWTQGERSSDQHTQPRGRVHMTDFDSPTARMIDALQRKSVQDVQMLLVEHQGYDWSVPNGSFVHPLRAALMHLPEAVPRLLEAGAEPSADAGWIGYSLIDDHKAFKAWLDCFKDSDHGKAFVLAVAVHGRFFNEHPIWTGLSEESKDGARQLVQESGTYCMRELLNIQPTYSDDVWKKSQWEKFAETLATRKEPTLALQM